MRPRETPTKNGCGSPSSSKEPRTYAEVVAKYIAENQHRGDGEMAWYAGRPDFGTLLEKAVMCRIEYPWSKREQKHPHQQRLSKAVLQKALEALSQCDFQSCRSFDELHDLIDRTAGSISGIGALAVFDFACRIGAGLKPPLQPTKIYLHSGTRDGAQAMGLGTGRKTLEVHELPPDFHGLSGRHAEDCLCIYKAELKKIASRGAR